LRNIKQADRLNELSFDIPVAGGFNAGNNAVTSRAIADIFSSTAIEADKDWLDKIVSLNRSPPLKGFLTGAIDLLFRCNVKGNQLWFIVDYKSNWLGSGGRSTILHYSPDALIKCMVEDYYILQYHIYLVAVHRYLKWKLGEKYSYDDCIGGVFYLFLRGMSGPFCPLEEGYAPGIYFNKPPRRRIEMLSHLFEHGCDGLSSK